MNRPRTAFARAMATAVAVSFTLASAAASAQASSAKAAPAQKSHEKSQVKALAKKLGKTAPKVESVPAEPASAEQIDAAERVFYGVYDCEFKQTVAIAKSEKFPAFVDLKHGKTSYLMKPVLSSTGAIRLEDIRGETLMVQISSKSMLLNVKTAQRLVDDCVSPRQRELTDAARAAKTAAAAAASGAEARPAERGLLSGAPAATPVVPVSASASAPR